MINQTPEQLQEYRARMKFQMDEIARFDYARLEGRQEGRQEGEFIGQISVLQSILGISKPTREELLVSSLSELTAIVRQLQQQLADRKP